MNDNRAEKKEQEAKNAANNTENIRNAADVAIASKNPYGVAAGTAEKIADAITGGKASEIAGSAMAKGNGLTGPFGKQNQNLMNNLNESGLGNKAGKVARMSNGFGGEPNNKGSQLAKQPTGNNMDTIGRGRNEPSSSLNKAGARPGTANSNEPSSTDNDQSRDSEEKDTTPRIAGIGAFGRQPREKEKEDKKDKNKETETDNTYKIVGSTTKRLIIFITLPLTVFILFVMLFATFTAVFGGSFEDALGASKASGEDLGTAEFLDGGTQEALDYYDRINSVKLEFQAQGKSFEANEVASVFHILRENGADLDYNEITEDKIREVANAMFSGNTYDQEHYKQELATRIIPKYLPRKTDGEIEDIVSEIDQYISDYNDYTEKAENSSFDYSPYGTGCSSGGNCQYDIKGFYINNKNISKSMQIDNIKVRLMQCGSPYGNGNDNTPINQDLVNFEDYVAGVAYAKLGDGLPIEAYKAQMVLARSFALARPTAVGNSNGKKLSQENGQWVLQISSCVSDQVYCDIDKGCSYMGGGDGQGGWVASGTIIPGAVRTKSALPGNSNLRKAMASTKGEVITNDQGYIIESSHNSSQQSTLVNMANNGSDYKQIIFKLIPNAKNIDKMTCNSSINCKVSTGEYANWKQCGASWSGVRVGSSGNNICGIGCLVTSVSMLIAKSGVQTIPNFNPGTFVEHLNAHGGFTGGNLLWARVSSAAPSFVWQGKIGLRGLSLTQKFDKIKHELDAGGYLVCEVKGNTGQHWVAVDSVNGSQIVMLDPGSNANYMWQEYSWSNTSECSVFKVR